MTTDSNEEYTKIVPNRHQYEVVSMTDKELLQQKTSSSTNDGDDIRSTKKGLFNQILVTGAVLVLAAACGMPIGYSAVLLPQLYNSSEPLSIDVEMGSWIASVHSLATPFGSLVSGAVADKFGRRPALILASFPLIVGWCILALSSSHILILAGRIIAGISVGLIGAPAQILIAEVAEPHIRGLLIGAPLCSYSLGILFVYALGSGLHWRAVAWCGNILPILSGIALFLIPESPAWLVRNGHLEKAQKALSWLRGDDVAAKRELLKLLDRFENERATTKSTDNFLTTCTKRTAIKPLLIINIFNFLQIFSGTYLVVFYAIDIISEFGADIDTMKAAVMTAIVRLICTFVFCFLLLILRRRMITVVSGIGSGCSCFAFGIYIYMRLGQPKTVTDLYVAAVCIILYIAFNTGFMVMPGIMIGELLPAKIRGQVAGYIFAIFNVSLFGIAKIFPMMNMTLKTHGLFMMFGISSFVAAIIMFLMLPETKGKSLGEIEDYFGNNNWFWFNRVKKTTSVESDNNNENCV